MSEKKKIGGIFFLIILIMGMVAETLLPDQEFSYTERRRLAQFPEVSWESILENDYSESLETYLLEQFPGRDWFRMIKAEVDVRVLGKSDSNGYVRIEEHLFEIQISSDEEQVENAVELFQEIAMTYFQDSNVYYAVIPDKNYFVDTIPQYDYENVDKILEDAFDMGIKIDLWDTLSLEDYYKTDLHAKQEALIPLANELLIGMGATEKRIDGDYEIVVATEEFYGGYSANSAYYTEADILYYLENKTIQEATVYDYETNTVGPVYTLDKLGEMDDYDMFLGGARALLTIQNPNAETGKRLLIFRDSYGSSIAPLLLDEYQEITVVDLRYVSANYAMELLEIESNQEGLYDDVLFLYQVQLLYNSNSMKRN